jgi:NADPH2:quinone reductase
MITAMRTSASTPMAGAASIMQLADIGPPADVLRFVQVPVPEPGADEVRIRVNAFALNRADWLYARGWHYTVPKIPSRIGSECSGIVDAVGAGVTNVAPGDRVATIPFDTSNHGVQGEFAIVPAAYVAPWPDAITAIQATSVWMQYLTAYFALAEVSRVGPADSVLVTAASSSAGLGAIQVAKVLGARVVATTRTASKALIIDSAGADTTLVIDDNTQLSARLLEATDGRGVNIVYDPVAGPFMRRYLGGLAMHGRVFLYGLLSGAPTELDIVSLVRRAAIVHPYSMFNHVCDPAQLQRGVAFVVTGLTSRQLTPTIGRVFSYQQTLEAYRELDREDHYGKIVVDVVGE